MDVESGEVAEMKQLKRKKKEKEKDKDKEKGKELST